MGNGFGMRQQLFAILTGTKLRAHIKFGDFTKCATCVSGATFVQADEAYYVLVLQHQIGRVSRVCQGLGGALYEVGNRDGRVGLEFVD